MTAAASVGQLDESAVRVRWLLIAGMAVLVLGIAGALGTLEGGLAHPDWFALFSITNVVAFTAAAALWLRERPTSRVGIMLLVLAAIGAVVAFQGSSSPLAFAVGVLADPLYLFVWTYFVLTFPTGRVAWQDATVLAVVIGTIVAGFIPWFFFTPHVAGATPLAACTDACPTNVLMIVDWPRLAGNFGRAEEVGRALFALLFVMVLAVRMLIATRPRRRVLAPIYAIGAAWGVAFGVYGIAVHAVPANDRAIGDLGWLLTTMRILIPLSFVLVIVAERSFAGVALAKMMAPLRDLATAAELQQVVGYALGDRSLRLAFWNAPSGGWVDVDGSRKRPPLPGYGRSWREISTEGGAPGAALEYDASLDEMPGLVDAAASAVKLSFDAQWLESELRLSEAELGQSELRSATIAAEQRTRLERNLHDSAQQRLLVIAMDLSRLRSFGVSDTTDAELARLGRELDVALKEIRDVARGNLPPTLNDLGLRAALAAAVRASPRTALRVGHLERYPPEAEATVYFSVLEAIQNATKHGSSLGTVTVSVWAGSGDVCFEVRDDGPGFDPTRARDDGGLAGLSRRVGAVGGTLTIASAPGTGTTISGRVPTG